MGSNPTGATIFLGYGAAWCGRFVVSEEIRWVQLPRAPPLALSFNGRTLGSLPRNRGFKSPWGYHSGGILDLKQLSEEIRAVNLEHGWDSYVGSVPERFSEKMLLIVSEISEALEEFRNHRGINEVYCNDEKPDKPEGIPIELADAIIRILDFCEGNDIDIVKAIEGKVAYNKTRPYRHGGKKA